MADLIGTVWKSKDRRESRYVRVEEFDHTYAYVRPCLPDGTEVAGRRRSRVPMITRGTRQTLRGYRLVSGSGSAGTSEAAG